MSSQARGFHDSSQPPVYYCSKYFFLSCYPPSLSLIFSSITLNQLRRLLAVFFYFIYLQLVSWVVIFLGLLSLCFPGRFECKFLSSSDFLKSSLLFYLRYSQNSSSVEPNRCHFKTLLHLWGNCSAFTVVYGIGYSV